MDIEFLSGTLMWKCVEEKIATKEETYQLLKAIDRDEVVKTVEIQDSEDFIISDGEQENGQGQIRFRFMMPFVMMVNEDFHLQALALGSLKIPDDEHFSYDEYDWGSMDRQQLLSHRDLVVIDELNYRDVEILNFE